MQVIGIKELQTNPSKLTKVFQAKDYLLITKHGQPLGLALPFDEDLMAQGLMPWYALKGFQSGDLSLGQLSKILHKNQHDTLRLLDSLVIPVADYDLAEDLEAINWQ
ncbi:MAG: type II toxin-antitoxin system Phd/YefM family antitoxin [Thiofilum sp.]|uniref:type II toxin-antitoxin system Phd/YefM family antitoxin n=1 Tax=Thiofilum sp. TaxID=2212733 RepID=UPI0025F499F0|nr:type II toxin-antitoxin system Phd/YefM family antitoxin [Thiofilum sp.]MBK8455088.1 type II toxin-antitoxin system Phd/YefM family antitoxin [Thiofilum sp.]